MDILKLYESPRTFVTNFKANSGVGGIFPKKSEQKTLMTISGTSSFTLNSAKRTQAEGT